MIKLNWAFNSSLIWKFHIAHFSIYSFNKELLNTYLKKETHFLCPLILQFLPHYVTVNRGGFETVLAIFSTIQKRLWQITVKGVAASSDPSSRFSPQGAHVPLPGHLESTCDYLHKSFSEGSSALGCIFLELPKTFSHNCLHFLENCSFIIKMKIF